VKNEPSRANLARAASDQKLKNIRQLAVRHAGVRAARKSQPKVTSASCISCLSSSETLNLKTIAQRFLRCASH